MPTDLPLPTLLSHALVAFTIEFDNEFEHRMPHRTTYHSATTTGRSGPWLVSLVMYSNCMHYVGEEGVKVRDLEKLARTNTNLHGMQRWGYVKIAPDPSDTRVKVPSSEWRIRATLKGRKAQQVWRPLFGLIEERWKARFGDEEIHQLRQSLQVVTSQVPSSLPDCLPILGYGLFSRVPDHPARKDEVYSELSLSTLQSRVLLAFAIEFEHDSDLSLAISADVLRVLDGKGVRLRDVPSMSGVSKEGIQMALGILQKRGLALLESDTSSRAKVVRLTALGLTAQAKYHRLLGTIEERWRERFGKNAIRALKTSLEQLVAHPSFLHGLKPYPDGWRASVRPPNTLPHYPMVLHRGGFPDGS